MQCTTRQVAADETLFFANNVPQGQKGGAISELASATLSMEETSFTNNMGGIGGSIYNSGGSVSMDGGAFTGNKAQTGGAVYDSTGLEESYYDVAFVGNSASKSGGAFYAKYTQNGLLDNCTFTNDYAPDGSDNGGYWGTLTTVNGKSNTNFTFVNTVAFSWVKLGN